MIEAILNRSGYGSLFNKIEVNDTILTKKALNDYGGNKLRLEIQSYKVYSQDVSGFPIAKLIATTSTSLSLQYYRNHIPLWQHYSSVSPDEQTKLLHKVFSHLATLHRCKVKQVQKEEYQRLLYLETVTKVCERYTDVKDFFEKNLFTKVNGIDVLSFHDCVRLVEEKTYEFINRKTEYTLCYIHGDPQFNNILYKEETNEFVFIDPRGYFGDSELYGIQEYDTAKVLFALSGYDVFDSMSECNIVIKNGNIDLPQINIQKDYEALYPELHFLLVSIWLANCHSFVNNPSKKLFSHAYARYLCTKILS